MALQWLTLVGAIWLQSINGTNSNFPAYSSQLKKILSIPQLKLNNLASASDAGKLLGFISGIAAAYLPLWLVLLIGSILGSISYGIQFLFLTDQISSLSYWHIFFLTILAGNSICWINTVCYIIAIRNFPFDRQIAVGLSTSYVGLSAKIYTSIVDFLAPNSPSDRAKLFLMLNSVLPVLVSLVSAPLVRDVSNVGKSKNLTKGFYSMFSIVIVTGCFAVISSLGSLSSKFLPKSMVFVGILVLLLLPLVVPLEERIRGKLEQKWLVREHDNEGFVSDFGSVESGEKMEFESGVLGEIGAKIMVKKVEFWLYVFVYLFGATLGLVYLNNLGQIAESRYCLATSSLVSLSAAFGFFGRFLPCLFDHFFPKIISRLSRAATMGFMMIPMCGAFFLLLNKNDISLYISTAIIGISTGAITSISVSTTVELFGTKNFAINHNILVANIPIGSFLFGDLAALFYNKERKYSREGNCMGDKCYQTTFVLWGSLCILGTFLTFVLHARTKKLCSKNRVFVERNFDA